MSWAELIEKGKAALAERRDTNAKVSASRHWAGLRAAVDAVLAGRTANPLSAEPPPGWTADARWFVASLTVDPADAGRPVWLIYLALEFDLAAGWGHVPKLVGGVMAPFAVPVKKADALTGDLRWDADPRRWKTADTLEEAAALVVEAMVEAEVAYLEFHRKRAERPNGVLA